MAITVEMLRKPLEKLRILMTKEQRLKAAAERAKEMRVWQLQSVENDRLIHVLNSHSDACISEIEYVLGIRMPDGTPVKDPHPSHPITFRACECVDRINGYRIKDTAEFGEELKHFTPEET